MFAPDFDFWKDRNVLIPSFLSGFFSLPRAFAQDGENA